MSSRIEAKQIVETPMKNLPEVPESAEALLQKMRDEGLPVVHTIFATIHHRNQQRPDGYTDEELDEIADRLHESDVERWKSELAALGDNGVTRS